MAALKSHTIYQTHLAFAKASEKIKFSIFDKMESEEKQAEHNVRNLAYAQYAMQKAMSAMLELNMATMYKDAMSKAIEADFKKGVHDYYERFIHMGKA